jgi:hypothetical protein
MNEKNLDYLVNQLKFTGFGEALRDVLKEKIEKQEDPFAIFHQVDFGNDHTITTLQFSKSAESSMYFFNRYSLMLKTPQIPYPVKQTFYINSHQSNITLKEAYNLMSGRAVHKELTPKEGEKYHAWILLDFKDRDKNENARIRQYHPNYGFSLESVLAKYPIRELGTEAEKTLLIDSLNRGNRQMVTLLFSGSEERMFIEASPQFKSLNFYDSSMHRLKAEKLQDIEVTLPLEVREDQPAEKTKRKTREKKTVKG